MHNYTVEKTTVSSISGAGKTGQLHVKNKLEHSLIPCTKINLKWIIDLVAKRKTIKPLENGFSNKREDLDDLEYDSDFLKYQKHDS